MADKCQLDIAATSSTYTIQMRDEMGSEEVVTITALDDQAAAEQSEEEARKWCEGGDWGEEGAEIVVRYWVFAGDEVGEDGDAVLDDLVAVVIEPDHDALIRRAGGDPDCDHDWDATVEIEGGCRENPGVWSNGGTAMTIRDHCRTCGLRRTHHSTGSQRNPGEVDTYTYEQPDSWCEE